MSTNPSLTEIDKFDATIDTDVKQKEKKEWDEEHPRRLIPELCKLMYHLGWVTGTGGGMSIKYKYVDSSSSQYMESIMTKICHLDK